MTALLTFGALQPRGVQVASEEWIQLAAVLAVLVGVVRLALGIGRGGVIAYLLSQPVLKGFTSAAAILIMASQIPTALGTTRGERNILLEAIDALTSPDRWDWGAVTLSVIVIAIILTGRRIHSLFPAVPLTIVIGIIVARATGYSASLVGEIPATFPPVSLDLPWAEVPSLVVPALVVALVGFAEPASIARMFASADREPWSANRELVSQGVANLASGISGGFPIGGSFSRTSIARIAGGHTRWSGAIVGVLVLAFLPIAGILSDLPRAVLAGIIIAAVVKLIRPDELWDVFRLTPPQGVVGAITFVATLALSPRIDLGVLIGIVLAILVHLWRELTLPISIVTEGSTMRVRPSGVIFFGSAQTFDDAVTDAVAERPEVDRVVIDLEGVGRLDFTAAMSLVDLAAHLRSGGCSVELVNVNPVARRIVDKVWTE